MLDWKVGDKIVCINDKPNGGGLEEIWPREGIIYTIRDIGEPAYYAETKISVRLQELVNTPQFYHDALGQKIFTECWFNVARFRPVTNTSLDIFRKLTTDPYGPIDDVGSQWDKTRKVKELT